MRTPGEGTPGAGAEALGYILSILVSVSARMEFVNVLINEKHILLNVLHHQTIQTSGRSINGSEKDAEKECCKMDIRRGKKMNQCNDDSVREIVAVLAHNLSLLSEFTKSIAISPVLTGMFVNSLKHLYENDFSKCGEVRILALTSLVNFATNNSTVRKYILGGNMKVEGEEGIMIESEDMIKIMEKTGYENNKINLRFIALLNLFSLEASLCLKLLERGVHTVLFSIVNSFLMYNDENCLEKRINHKSKILKLKRNNSTIIIENIGNGTSSSRKKSETFIRGSEIEKSRDSEDAITVIEAVTQRLQRQASESSGKGSRHSRGVLSINNPIEDDDELIMDIAGAVMHNLSLKKAIIDTGILSCLLFFSKNCKSLRVLHCVRCLANISTDTQSRVALKKERYLVPILINSMRYGCADAERVQHYGAQVICNVLACGVDRTIIQELILIGAVTDLIVVALLRVNGFIIKETLCKVLFNLLTTDEFRVQMIELDVLSTIIELGKTERVEVLELCARCVYNITCQTDIFSIKMRNIGMPNFLMSRAIGTVVSRTSIEEHPALPESTTKPKNEIFHDSMGNSSSNSVKLFSGKGLANISFDKKMAKLLCCELGINAIISISKLNCVESSYCASVILFNTSILSECVVFNNSNELIHVLMELIVQGPLLSSQLAVASLLNFTRYPIFFEQVLHLYFFLFSFFRNFSSL